MKNPLLTFLALLAFGAGNLQAAKAEEKVDAATVRKLLARVESLESEVRQLRAEKSSAPRTASRGGTRKKEEPPAEESPSVVDETLLGGSFPRLKIRGFGDVDYHWAERGPDRNAFRLGQLDLFFTSELAENLSALAEMVIEADEHNHFGIEIERLLLQYKPREYFNVAVGRYHTAIGYYNTAYHHGRWLQTAVGRPNIFSFEDEGGLLPIHNVGVSISGAIPSGGFGLHYVAEVGNGRRYDPGVEAVQSLSDDNGFKAVNLAIFARPDWLPGLQAGASVYFDRISLGAMPPVKQTIFSAHAVYVTPAFEWLNEAVIVHDSTGVGTFDSFAAYTQIAKQFGKFRPYARYQYTDLRPADPIVQSLGMLNARHVLSLGVRFDFSSLSAFKVQLDHPFGASPAGNEVTTQFSFTF